MIKETDVKELERRLDELKACGELPPIDYELIRKYLVKIKNDMPKKGC
ncbi:MAG: hypothetical protein FWF59_05395 [Turicibacter sp.]|nr:hypothetical protein [Turicibacter sp.]